MLNNAKASTSGAFRSPYYQFNLVQLSGVRNAGGIINLIKIIVSNLARAGSVRLISLKIDTKKSQYN